MNDKKKTMIQKSKDRATPILQQTEDKGQE